MNREHKFKTHSTYFNPGRVHRIEWNPASSQLVLSCNRGRALPSRGGLISAMFDTTCKRCKKLEENL